MKQKPSRFVLLNYNIDCVEYSLTVVGRMPNSSNDFSATFDETLLKRIEVGELRFFRASSKSGSRTFSVSRRIKTVCFQALEDIRQHRGVKVEEEDVEPGTYSITLEILES